MSPEENAAICQQIVERKQQEQRRNSQRLLNEQQRTPNQQQQNNNNYMHLNNTPRIDNRVGMHVIIFLKIIYFLDCSSLYS